MQAPKPEQQPTLSETVLDRKQLLIAFLEATSASMIGADDQEAQRALKGRRFEIRMRFGCPDAQPQAERSWSYIEGSGALKVTVSPDIDRGVERVGPATAGPGADDADASERGFYIPSPTLLANGCPTADFAAAAGFTNLRFGIVQRTGADEPRARALLDSYEIVKKINPQAVPTQGLDLILRGRLDAGAAGNPISCAPRGGTVQCLASSVIDHVSIEDPVTRVLIAEWGAR